MTLSAPPAQPVLIVGAGPTGLTLALILARYDIPVRIVEKKSGLSRHTKATNLMQRTQEMVAALGMLDPLNKISGQMRRIMVHAYGRHFGPRTMHLAQSPFSNVVLCGQHNYEAVIAQGLSDAGIQIEFNTTLTKLEQDQDGVTATLASANGNQTARFAYAIGCDGYSGITRTFTKHDFEPTKTGVAIRQIDCTLTWRRLPTMDQMWLFYFDKGFAVVVPLPNGVHRLLTIEPKPSIPERDPTLEEMQSAFRRITDDETLTLTNPNWFSYTDLAMGIGNGLRDGRIILAGDVGNPVLPNGGQGMNTGIGDAFNLGWKLASVVRHGGSEALLDSYEAERHALRRSLQTAQFNSLKYTTLVTPKPVQALFRWFAEPLLNSGGEYKMAQAFSELMINTRKSTLTLDTVGKTGLRAGDRALDADVVHNGAQTRIYDVIYRGGWTLLGFTGRGDNADVHRTLSAMSALERPDITTFLVSTRSQNVPDFQILYDLDEVAHRAFQVKSPSFISSGPMDMLAQGFGLVIFSPWRNTCKPGCHEHSWRFMRRTPKVSAPGWTTLKAWVPNVQARQSREQPVFKRPSTRQQTRLRHRRAWVGPLLFSSGNSSSAGVHCLAFPDF